MVDEHKSEHGLHEPALSLRVLQSGFDAEGFLDGYVLQALWCDCMPPDDDPDGELGGRTHLDLRPEARERMRAGLSDFVECHLDDLLAYCEALGAWAGSDSVRGSDARYSAEERAGGDFWLTRNGHGTGFWDRGLGELGERLTAAAKSYGSSDDHRPYDCGDGTANA